MMLIDTSVWIAHLDHGIYEMEELLIAGNVLMHAFIIGELAMGNLKSRLRILEDLSDISPIQPASDEEVLSFVGRFRLHGIGIGYVDAHLLASTRITPDCKLWTRDKRMKKAATDLGIASPLV